jgi:phosphoribosylanthranilate isomerase
MSVPKVKICGVTSLADARLCADVGADWVGLNFHFASPRYVEPALAAEITAGLPAAVEAVGVFVDRAPQDVLRSCTQARISIAQLHGSEPAESLVDLGPLKIVRAFRLANEDAISAMLAYLDTAERSGRRPDAVLVDAFVPGIAGGTGHTIREELLASLPPLDNLILAGGLTPENVAEYSARLHPWMVDVASGVESAPGKKDPRRVKAFIAAIGGGITR